MASWDRLRFEAEPTSRTAPRKDANPAKGTGKGLDLPTLAQEAARSDAKEAYRSLSKGATHRLGVAARIEEDGTTAYSVEVLVRALGEGTDVQISMLAAALRISRRLRARGYTVDDQGDGWMAWEKAVSRGRVARECEGLLDLVARETDRLARVEEPAPEDAGRTEV